MTMSIDRHADTIPPWFQDLTGQGIVVADLALRIRSWSRWMEMHSGHRAADVLGQDLRTLYPDLQARNLVRYFELALGGQTTVLSQRLHRYLFPMPSSDPAFPHMQQSARIGPLIRDGAVAGVVVVIDDVSERVSHEQDLQRLLENEQAARASAEASQRQLSLIAEVSALLANTLDVTAVLPQVARMLLPLLGDLCVIELLGEDGAVRRAVMAHIDPAKDAVLQELGRRYPAGQSARRPALAALRTRRAEVVADVSAAPGYAEGLDAPRRELIEALGTRSVLATPLLARERTIGVLTLCSAALDRYHEADGQLAEDVARRIALAIDSWQLYNQAQEALRSRDTALAIAEAERAKLQRLFAQAPAAIAVLQGPRHEVSFANLYYRRIFGEREYIGRALADVVPELAVQGAIDLLDQVYRSGEPHMGDEAPLLIDRCGDGVLEQHFFTFVYQPTLDPAGAIEGVLIHMIDVTEQVSAQRERERLAALVREQGEHLRVTLSSIADAVIVTDLNGMLTFINQVAEQLTGWGHAEVLGRPVEDVLALIEEGSGALAENPIRRVLSSHGPIAQAASALLVPRSGAALPIESSAAPIRDDADRTIGVVLVFRDTSARRRAELERADLLERTEAAVRMRDVFFSVAAHELKTPLTSLMGNIQLIQRRAARDMALPERELHNLGVAVSQARRLRQMIDALLDVTRIESGQLSLAQAPLALGALLQQIVGEIQPTLRAHTLLLELPDAPLMVHGDALRLEQVFQNLVQNAVKYSPAGGPIRISAAARAGRAVVSVADQGIGIPSASMPMLFQRFHRAANVTGSYNISGMGIGLFVVKEIVSLHGGDVAVESEENRGSTFTVTLPLLPLGNA
ncbi:PAS domain-containing protein [Chloroflexia bacterium SDU3-3]|nr:PAS domain-containing protein [Chloroflexia bacterium SDU3-3]